MSMGIFLVLILVGALLLLAFISAPRPKRRRSASGHRGGRPGVQTLSRDQISTRWQTIQSMASSGGGNGLRQAINEADKLLDHVMRQQGARGDTMADRLRSVQDLFSDRDSVWRAHKIRNSLAHDVGYDLVASQAQEALNDFHRALTDLGAL